MLPTPWGDADALRERPAAANGERQAARREQRERLFAAMVANCERESYEATSVADLLEVSGLSRGTFYAQFDDKADCFCAAEKALIEMSFEAARSRLGEEGDAEARARRAFGIFIDLLVAQPAAARMTFVESYAAGGRALEPLQVASREVIQLTHGMLEQVSGRAGIPLEAARAMVGGFHLIVYRRLQDRREEELPDLVPAMWEWAMSYVPPPRPLKPNGRRPTPAPAGPLPPFAAYSPEQRIIRAFATAVSEKGYPATTIADICATAGISQTTFYLHFADKRDLLAAALDSSGAQMLAATMPAARRAPDWRGAVRTAAEASACFLASEPALARLRMVDLYSAGPEVIAIRDELGLEFISGLISPARAEGLELSDLVLEATVGAIFGVYFDRVLRGSPADLLDTAPLITYLILAPLIGAEEACEVAVEKPNPPRLARA